ncbi:hypothetical protein [Flavobacterium sp. PL02]|uniref:hypothetical protein n=1 Tax=Flavobacterium sp. PL02 TaxID=3088354 RepID=UPI002B2391B2|nr:hypothetical protein [Flavobacterium sp. PL02]MEA9413217.1 hypothetical protein [Flavobacterium sp. PL02]
MNKIRMENNFRLKLGKNSLILFAFVTILVGCKRIEKTNDDSSLSVEKKLEISSKEIQRILSTKANLENTQVSDEMKLSIPENYYFRTSSIKKDEIDADSKFGKLALATKDSYDYVEIINSLFVNSKVGEESVVIIKDDNPSLLTIDDLKEDYEIETIYFEDENSIVFSEDKTFTTIHFQYDPTTKSYLIYRGSISWSKAFPNEDKLDLAFYFLRNAKNLLSTNFTKQEFTWKDYVDNRPKIEINLMKFYFKNFKKEMGAFLNVNEISSPEYDGHSLVKLYRLAPNGDALFYEYLNKLETGQSYGAQDTKWASELFYTDDKCKVIPKGNSSIVEITSLNYAGEVYEKEFMVFSIINYDKKAFLLKTENNLNEKTTDFFVKMFNYYSENFTLDLANKK